MALKRGYAEVKKEFQEARAKFMRTTPTQNCSKCNTPYESETAHCHCEPGTCDECLESCCVDCDTALCSKCNFVSTCQECGELLCSKCRNVCGNHESDKVVCANCFGHCGDCELGRCNDCLRGCKHGDERVCVECTYICPRCGERVCWGCANLHARVELVRWQIRYLFLTMDCPLPVVNAMWLVAFEKLTKEVKFKV